MHVVAFVPHLVLGVIAVLSPDTLTNEAYRADGGALPTPSERWPYWLTSGVEVVLNQRLADQGNLDNYGENERKYPIFLYLYLRF